MTNTDVRPMELLLQVIADELYVARMDRQTDGASKSDWKDNGGRDLMIERIEKARERFDSYPEL
jgi:hypothetical protein